MISAVEIVLLQNRHPKEFVLVTFAPEDFHFCPEGLF